MAWRITRAVARIGRSYKQASVDERYDAIVIGSGLGGMTTARFEQRLLRPKTPLENLWLTGQNVVTCGVGGALLSGFLTASAITGENLVMKALR